MPIVYGLLDRQSTMGLKLSGDNRWKRESYTFGLIIALVLGGCSRGIDEYVRQSRHVDVDVRVYGIGKLGESGQLDAVPHLIRALKDEKVRVRLAVIDALGMLKDRQATEVLIPFLQDKRAVLALAAIDALGEIGDSTAVDAVGRYCARGGACIAIGGDRCVG